MERARCRKWFVTLLMVAVAAAPTISSTSLTNFLQALIAREQIATLLLIDCQDGEAFPLQQLQIPLVLATREASVFSWKQLFGSRLLTLQCLRATNTVALTALDRLAIRLQHMREAPVVLHIDRHADSGQALEEASVAGFLQHCAALRMLNAVAVLGDFATTGRVYAFENFPRFRLQRRVFPSRSGFFADKLRDVAGHPLYTLPDQNIPRSFIYRDAGGALQLSGYLGKMMQTFAALINATLRLPYEPAIGASIYVTDLVNYTRAGLIDMATGLGSPKWQRNMNEHSIVLEFSTSMPMLPVELQLTVAERYQLMLSSELTAYLAAVAVALSVVLTWQERCQRPTRRNFWLQALLNDKLWRGILGQAFPARSDSCRTNALLVLVLLTGLVASSSYAGFLNTLLTHPPTQPRINTFEDLRRSPLKILLARQQVPIVINSRGEEFWQRYGRSFEIVPTWPEYLRHRTALNTTHGYAVTTSLWSFISQHQAVFRRKLFRLSRGMYFEEVVIYCLPMQENSIYKPAMNRFILHWQEAGMMRQWRLRTFFDMLATGNIGRRDMPVPGTHTALAVPDLLWLWVVYGCGVLLASAVCLCEWWAKAHRR